MYVPPVIELMMLGKDKFTLPGGFFKVLEDEDEIEEAENFLYNNMFSSAHKEECRNYLKKVRPDMSCEDARWASNHVYKCRGCGRHYPIWWISNEEWKNSLGGFFEKMIATALGETVEEAKMSDLPGWGLLLCKECFEIVSPKPNYFTIDEYITKRLIEENGLKENDRAELKKILTEIWDLSPA